jgi:hypothetical protein
LHLNGALLVIEDDMKKASTVAGFDAGRVPA